MKSNKKLEKQQINPNARFTLAMAIVMIIFFIPLAINHFREEDDYNKHFKEQDKIIFGTYNENYKDKTDENSKRVEVILIKQNEKGLKSLFNFISHMNGKIEKINDIEVKNVELSGENIGKIKLANEFSLFNDKIYRSIKEDRIYYTILLPNSEKTIYNVKERLDNYLRFGIDG